jgi:hypothetical protein
MSGSAPSITDWLSGIGTCFGALGTFFAFGAALWQISNERKARKKAEKEAISERIRAQAVQISAWVVRFMHSQGNQNGVPLLASVLNASKEPVYEVIISLVSIQGAGYRDARQAPEYYTSRKYLSVLPPGQYYISIPSGGNAMMVRYGLEICFTDSSGRHWVRKGNGNLIEINQSPPDYYNVPRPIGWEYPTERIES